MVITGNKGEWSEIFIFLKLMGDRKIHAADADMNRLDEVFLNIIKIIREEIRNNLYEYYTGDVIKIHLNSADTGKDVPVADFMANKDKVFDLLSRNQRGTFGDDEIEDFLSSIFITKLKAPAISSSDYFGGTQDIIMSIMDYRSGITRTVGFSCKSDFGGRATLFNASYDNTNFMYEITRNIDDDLMNDVNSLFVIRNGKENIATGERIRALKNAGCDLNFIKPCKSTAARNLVLSGGKELPVIVGCALKYYYWEGENSTSHAPIRDALQYVTSANPAEYTFDNHDSIYRRKFSDLLYNMFTGMRMAKPWDGRSSVNGGYVVMKNDGDVVAYHSCIADEFKDFLVNRLGFETPSNSRHNAMQIYKIGDRYFINFNLQIRFC